MRLPWGLLLIVGLIVFMYLFGLLIAYKRREFSKFPSPEPDIRSFDDQPAVDIEVMAYLENGERDILRQKIPCDNKMLRPRRYQRGLYWVLENYVAAEKRHINCYESVTYTTHTDYTFLDNLVPVVDRWRAPVSVAIFTPGDDFNGAVDTIYYLRNCLDNQMHMNLIKEFVSFHLYFRGDHMPPGDLIPSYSEVPDLERCAENPMSRETYKSKNNIFYPVNVGRNVARDAAATHFVFPSDIELYPSPGIVPKFLKMIAKEPGPVLRRNRVFPIAIYEVAKDSKVPKTKSELVTMLGNKQAQRFHKSICATCHSVPDNDKWEATPQEEEMRIFAETTRTGKFYHWEPIYIGTQDDPHYDERLSWEGKSDKMTQGYLLCALNYKLSLLSDAFLVHRPGFKTFSEAVRPKLEAQAYEIIRKEIGPELYKVYGKKEGCNL